MNIRELNHDGMRLFCAPPWYVSGATTTKTTTTTTTITTNNGNVSN